MRIAYLDCFCGLSGDMMLGALVDAGVPLDGLRDGLRGLGAFTLDAEPVLRGAVRAVRAVVGIGPRGHEEGPEGGAHVAPDHEHGYDHGHDPHHEHRHGHHLAELLARIDGAGLPPRVAARARRAFERLADAEARVHGLPPAEVHLHEVGALDALVDICGAALGLELLGVERLVSRGATLGRGSVRAAHGELPVPAPATLYLLEGVPSQGIPIDRELTTPTGAAILSSFVDAFEPLPACRILRTGYGAGARDLPERPNICRLVLGETPVEAGADASGVVLLEANLDDATPELVAVAIERLLEAGALDAWASPITMKKGRPALCLSALAEPARRLRLEEVLFRETPTFGVRRVRYERSALRREVTRVETPYGAVAVKLGWLGEDLVHATPELESCRALAKERGATVRQVYLAAQRAAPFPDAGPAS